MVKHSRKRIPAPLILGILGALVVLSGWAIIFLAKYGYIDKGPHYPNGQFSGQYCESWDFGGDDCQVDVRILNDTSNTFTIKQCSGSFNTPQCKAFAETDVLTPGESQVATGTAEKNPPQPWLIANKNGSTVGCLNLQFTEDQLNPYPVTVDLSKLIPCKAFL